MTHIRKHYGVAKAVFIFTKERCLNVKGCCNTETMFIPQRFCSSRSGYILAFTRFWTLHKLFKHKAEEQTQRSCTVYSIA
jgi:hypothetical protein